MKLRDLIAFLSNYEDLMDSDIEIPGIPAFTKQENLIITQDADLFGQNNGAFVLTYDDCFDGSKDEQ